MRPVDLFHIGPQKAATTWVHRCLREHPEIACPVEHEIHYFDVFYARGRGWYVTFFEGAEPGQKLFDPTYTYIRSPWAAERIAAENPAGRSLCGQLGLDFDPAMLRYYEVPQHVIGGNPAPTHEIRAFHGRGDQTLEFLAATSPENQAFYRDRAPGFEPDLRWKEELSDEALARFAAIAGATNRALGYDAPSAATRTKSTST